MPSKPRKNQYGTYFTTWSDKSRTPKQKNESLDTKDLKEANKHHRNLVTLYENGYHDPWEKPWHKNRRIMSYVRSGVIDLAKLASNELIEIPSAMAIQEFILYKKFHPYGWGEYTKRGEPHKIETFLSFLPPYLHQTQEHHLLANLTRDKINTPGEPLSDWYIYGLSTVWNTFNNWAVKKNYMSKLQIKRSKPQKQIPRFITNEDLAKACNDKLDDIEHWISTNESKPDNTQAWMVLAWLVMRYSGIRPRALMLLKLKEYEQGVLTIGKSFKVKDYEERDVSIDPKAWMIFELLHDPEFRKLDRWMSKSTFLFGRKGNTMQKRLSSEFSKYSKRDLYELRNTFAAMGLTQETQHAAQQLYFIQMQMGHSSINQTMDYLKALNPNVSPSVYHDFSYIPPILERIKKILKFC